MVFVAAAVFAVVAGSPPHQGTDSAAANYLATDGTRQLLSGPSTQVRWTGHQPGSRAFVDGPPEFISGALAGSDVMDATWVVESEDNTTGHHPQLMRLDDDGLHTWTATWPQVWTFTPARPEIPADPRAGARVTTTGTASTLDQEVSYSSTLEVVDAAAAGPDCLEFRRTDRIGDQPATTTTRVRCPGRGVVLLTLPVGAGTATWTAVPDWPAATDPRPGLDLTDDPGAMLTGLRPEPVVFERIGVEVMMTPAGAPALVEDTLVLPAQLSGNINWAQRVGPGELFGPGAWAALGGDLITSARCGEVVVAATTQRRLIAHDTNGGWLWTTELRDVAATTPTRMGGHLLVATKDSALQAVSCRDGSVLWSIRPVVSLLPPAVGPAGVLVASGDGVRLLNPRTGITRWERGIPDPVTALAQIGDVALIATQDNHLFVVEAATGDLRTEHRLLSEVAEFHDLGDVVVARGTHRIIGLDQRWRSTWSLPFTGHDSLDDGAHVVVANLTEVVTVDGAGHLVARQAQPLDERAAGLVLSRTNDGYLASDFLGTIVRWRP